MKKKAVQAFLVVCLVLTVAIGGCSRSETSAPSPNLGPSEEVIPEPVLGEEPSSLSVVDSDGDGFSDWFETNIAFTEPDVPNDRYIILFEYVPEEEEAFDAEINRFRCFFAEKGGVPAENIVALRGEEAIRSNLQEAIEEVAEKANENDIVLLSLLAHGGEDCIVGYPYLDTPEIEARIKTDPNFCCTDYYKEHGYPGYPSISYTDIDKWLDEITAKAVIVTIWACGCQSALPIMKDGPCPRIVLPCRVTTWFLQALGVEPLHTAFVWADVIYGNENKYVSIGEIKRLFEKDPEYQAADEESVAGEIYLLEYTDKGYPGLKEFILESKESGELDD